MSEQAAVGALSDSGIRERAPRGASDPTRGILADALFDDERVMADARHDLLPRIAPIYRRTMAELGVAAPDPGFLLHVLLPLTRFLGDRIDVRRRNCLIGLGGGPGVGKSTLSRLLSRCLPVASNGPLDCLSLSLDDFYRPRDARLRRGYKWRTLPGTHDTERLADFVAAFDGGTVPLSVPRYDLGRDAPAPDDVRHRAPDVCVFDGAMVGARMPGYGALTERLDLLIYLDAPVSLLKRWRFERERKLRSRSGGAAGFSPRDMADFWREALRPSIDAWVAPNAASADLVIGFGTGPGGAHGATVAGRMVMEDDAAAVQARIDALLKQGKIRLSAALQLSLSAGHRAAQILQGPL